MEDSEGRARLPLDGAEQIRVGHVVDVERGGAIVMVAATRSPGCTT